MTARHSGTSLPHRGANAHPDSQGIVSVGDPGIGCSGAPRGESRRGMDASSPPVYGCDGRANSSWRPAASTMRPEYITLTWSHSPATMPRS